MSAVINLPVPNTPTLHLVEEKDNAPKFTAVNDFRSPPSPLGSNVTNGMRVHQSPTKPSGPRLSNVGYDSGSSSSSHNLSNWHWSPDRPTKWIYSKLAEEVRSIGRTTEALQHQPLPAIDQLRDHDGSIPPMTTSHPSVGKMERFESKYSAEASSAGVQQIDAKERKRQFSRRTKTGCRTCRRRKKKCDEAKPNCRICIQGGFVCEGYASKVLWSGRGITKPSILIRAKEPILDPTITYPRCSNGNQVHDPHCAPVRSNSQPHSDTHPLNKPERARTQLTIVDEQGGRPSAPSSGNVGWDKGLCIPPLGHPSSPPMAAQDSQPPMPYNKAPLHEHPMMVSHNVESHHQTPQPTRPSPIIPRSRASAPSMPQLLYAPQSRLHKTEKEKMLCGEPFLPYTKQLIDERAQCAVAVYGFNSLANTSIMTAHGYRERHFKQIIAAARTHQSYTDCSQRYIRGFLGSNTYITTPIHCDYGYNISIGDNVNIGPHCVFLDSAMIFIGKNTKVGARVTISTLKAPTDSKALKGSNGTEVAQEVVIGENVYISDNVSIEAGVKIGNNAIIRSGSIVVVDVAPGTVARGNPAFT